MHINATAKNKDGSITVYFNTVPNYLKKVIKEYYNKKRFTKKLFRCFVIEAIQDYLKTQIKEK